MEIKHNLNRARVNLNDTSPLFIQCPVCAKAIRWSQTTQDQFQAGGVGHRCFNCKSYIGVVICGGCEANYLIDDEKWCAITTEKPFICSNCEESLVPRSAGDFSLALNVIETTKFYAFTSSDNENKYVEIVKTRLAVQKVELLALYHQTTYERFCLAKEQLDNLTKMEIPLSFKVFNTSELIESSDAKNKTKGADHIAKLYILAVSLFSAIESVMQEVNIVCDLQIDEGKVSYALLGKIPPNYQNLKSICDDIWKDERFLYLKDLRNVLVHRKIALLATLAKYDIPRILPFSPLSVEGECINYLPDNPLAKPGKECFENKKEIKNTVKELSDYVSESIDNIYLALAKEFKSG